MWGSGGVARGPPKADIAASIKIFLFDEKRIYNYGKSNLFVILNYYIKLKLKFYHAESSRVVGS